MKVAAVMGRKCYYCGEVRTTRWWAMGMVVWGVEDAGARRRERMDGEEGVGEAWES